MSRNNQEAWEQLKKEGLAIDVQVDNDGTSRVGFVKEPHDDGVFAYRGSYVEQKFSSASVARRDSNALARALSRKTGIPLHRTVPAERYKKHPSYTMDGAKLRALHDMKQREMENAYWDSPRTKIGLVAIAIIGTALVLGLCYLSALVLSWNGG